MKWSEVSNLIMLFLKNLKFTRSMNVMRCGIVLFCYVLFCFVSFRIEDVVGCWLLLFFCPMPIFARLTPFSIRRRNRLRATIQDHSKTENVLAIDFSYVYAEREIIVCCRIGIISQFERVHTDLRAIYMYESCCEYLFHFIFIFIWFCFAFSSLSLLNSIAFTDGCNAKHISYQHAWCIKLFSSLLYLLHRTI